MEHCMDRLRSLAAEYGPLCVGLDTDPSYLPAAVVKGFSSPAQAVLAYNTEIIARIKADGSACCCKVQAAYYEAMGVEGMQVYARTLKAVRESGLVCISDVKRGDIAASATAYARAHFSGDFETDIITVNPYMGFDTVKAFTDFCMKEGKGIFVLLRTSNPGMCDIEQQELKAGGRVLDKVAAELNRIVREGKASFPGQTCSPVGAVVGATYPEQLAELREKMPHTWLLVPGFGAQGGTAKSVAPAFHANGFFLIPGYGAQGGAASIARTLLGDNMGTVNSSRGILCAWKKDATCQEKDKAGTLTLSDIADSAARAAVASKKDLLAL